MPDPKPASPEALEDERPHLKCAICIRFHGDPLNRSWSNTYFDDEGQTRLLRSTLVSFIAFGPDREAHDLGSGFIIAGNGGMAVVVTAKHVIEYAARIQAPHPRATSSSPFVKPALPSCDPKRLVAIWMGKDSANILHIHHIEYNDVLDVAVCVVTPPTKYANPFAPASVPLDTRAIKVGQQIVAVSCKINKTEELAPPQDKAGRGQILKVSNDMVMRTGVITALHPSGFRNCRWPCFTASIPVDPGMSGGFVYVPRQGDTLAAVGVLCAGPSAENLGNDCNNCGEAVIAEAWTALGVSVPERLPANGAPRVRLREMIVRGAMPMAVGGVDHVLIHECAGAIDYDVEFVADAAPAHD